MTAVLFASMEAGDAAWLNVRAYEHNGGMLLFWYGAAIMLLVAILAVCVAVIDRAMVAAGSTEDEPNKRDRALEASIGIWMRDVEETFSGKSEAFAGWLAPYLTALVAIVASSALFFGPAIGIADLNIGLLFILAVSSLGVFGALLNRTLPKGNVPPETLRDAARWVSYQAAAVLGLISALLFAGSFAMKDIVQAQSDQSAWFIFYAPVGFAIYCAASIAGSGRLALELRQPSRSDSVAGAPGNRSLRQFLALLSEYLSMIAIAGIATTVFLGGWLRPLAHYHDRLLGTPVEILDAFPSLLFLALAAYCLGAVQGERPANHKRAIWIAGGICALLAVVMAGALFASNALMAAVHGAFWFCAKMAAFLYGFLWIRMTLSTNLFENWMRRAWRMLVPLALVNVIFAAGAIVLRQRWDFSPGFSVFITTLATVGFAIWLRSSSREIRKPAAAKIAAGAE